MSHANRELRAGGMRLPLAGFVLDLARDCLLDGSGQPVEMRPQVFALLRHLATSAGRVVSRDELFDAVWPGLVVTDNSLAQAVSDLRMALGVAGAHLVKTVPRRGFLLVADADVPADERAAEPRTNLPGETDRLIGREADLATLDAWLAQHRLVTLLGAGGVGKTRLALAAARANVTKPAHGVWWVDLAALPATAASVEPIALAIARVLGVRLGGADALASLVRSLARREMLLVLDNAEPVVARVAEVARALLAGAAGVRLLVTSQEPLHCAGEQVVPVEPLAVPPPATPLREARSYAAVQLLEDRARAADPRFELSEHGLELAIDLCRRLDGIPLAIEMAAARLSGLGVEALHALLASRLDLLRSASRDPPSRQQTLRAAVDWTHALLDLREQAVLRRLAVFAGSFALPAAVRVAALGDLGEAQVIDSISGLVERSLLKREGGETARYRLAETTRLSALERLHAAAEADAAQCRHCEAMAEIAAGEISMLSEADLLRRFAPDYDDLVAAFEHACDRQLGDLASVLFHELRWLDQLSRWFPDDRRRVEAAYALLPHASAAGQARLCSVIASVGWVAVEHRARVDTARQAVRLWRDLGNRHELHAALCLLATEAARVAAFAEAERALSEAEALEDATGPPLVRANRFMHAGWVARFGGDLPAYGKRMQEARDLYLQQRWPRAAAHTHNAATHALLLTGRIDEAIASSRAALAELESEELRAQRGVALARLCDGLVRRADFAGAHAAAVEALPLLEELDSVDLLLEPLAELAVGTGQPAPAATLLGYAEALLSQLDHPREAADVQHIEQVAAKIDEALGAAEAARLRLEGRLAGAEHALMLVHQVLDKAAPPAPE